MAEPHTTSYYAASRNDTTQYPPLDGSTKADICVIGGGFSGVSTALDLAERGFDVVLLEANRIGWGASGRNGGQLIGGINGSAAINRQLGDAGRKLVHDLHFLGNEIVEERIAKYQIKCDFKHGWMEVAVRPKHMAELRSHYSDLVANGHAGTFSIVEPVELAEKLGTHRYHGGLLDKRSGHLHPLNLVLGEARAAAGLGVRIHEDTRVEHIEAPAGANAKPWVLTSRGRVDANAIVLAGNTDHQFKTGRLRGLLFPTGSYIIATEPLSPDIVAEINPHDLAICDSNVVLDYYRLTADKRMLFGGRANYSNRDPKDITQTLQPRMVEIFPQLAKTRIDYSWGGRIGIVLNRAPAIGRFAPNVYFMQGYCGHGVNTTHIASRLVADAITGTQEQFDLFDRIKHWQLPMPQWMGSQMLALGMLYYRLRDRL